MSHSIGNSIEAPMPDWSTNYLSTAYWVLRTESIGHLAFPTYEAPATECEAER
jgi:hypothetical protein